MYRKEYIHFFITIIIIIKWTWYSSIMAHQGKGWYTLQWDN